MTVGSLVCIMTVYYPQVFYDGVAYAYGSPINSSSISAVRAWPVRRLSDPLRAVIVLNVITISLYPVQMLGTDAKLRVL